MDVQREPLDSEEDSDQYYYEEREWDFNEDFEDSEEASEDYYGQEVEQESSGQHDLLWE